MRRFVILGGILCGVVAVLLLLRGPAPVDAPGRNAGVPEADDARTWTFTVPTHTAAVAGLPRRRAMPRAPLPAPVVSPDAPNAPTDPDAIPNEAVFRFYNGADRDAFARLAESMGIEILGRMAFGNALRLRVDDPAALARLLEEGPIPLDRSSNYAIRPPDDPQLERREPEGALVPFGDRLLEWLGVEGRNAEWGRGVTIAVLDTLVGRHPGLPEQQITRVDNYGLTAEGALGGHGTAVASLIVGDGYGAAGLAPQARIVSIPVMSGEGVGDTFTLSQAILDAIAMNVDIINLSLGTAGDSPLLRDAIRMAVDNHIAVVASTGNDAVNAVSYPARYDIVIAVGAIGADGRHVYFSNSGPEVDIAAPGLGIDSAWLDDALVRFSGTSAAAPIISAAIAGALSRDDRLKPTEAAALVVRYADDAGAPGRDEALGSGVLNINRVLARGDRWLYDMTAVEPYVVVGDDGRTPVGVQVYAQNRGTETIPRVTLRVDVDGQPRVVTFSDVAVGESVTAEVDLTPEMVSRPGGLTIRHEARVEGAEDAHPADNGRYTLLRLVESAPAP